MRWLEEWRHRKAHSGSSTGGNILYSFNQWSAPKWPRRPFQNFGEEEVASGSLGSIWRDGKSDREKEKEAMRSTQRGGCADWGKASWLESACSMQNKCHQPLFFGSCYRYLLCSCWFSQHVDCFAHNLHRVPIATISTRVASTFKYKRLGVRRRFSVPHVSPPPPTSYPYLDNTHPDVSILNSPPTQTLHLRVQKPVLQRNSHQP